MAHEKLSQAKSAKNDEFYTQFRDIETEMNAYLEFDPTVFQDKTILLPCDDPEWSDFTKYFAQNFEKLGLKKLISTSYAPNSKTFQMKTQPTLFELESPLFDSEKANANGKIFTLSRDVSGDKKINVQDLEWRYLEGDGDFRSNEIRRLRDEADIIITNPPFSLAESFNGLYKNELIHRKGPWRNVEHVEWETLNYVDWFNNRRIHEALDYVPPAEFEATYYESNESESLAALETI